MSGVFQSMGEKVGRFRPRDQLLLIPEMNRIGSHLMAGAFRAFGVDARVMETYKGLDLGKEFTSGKECFPCQVTLGDILLHMRNEKERLGTRFDPRKYIYFMPESDGPCRFGMYNKYQRIVLDSFPELEELKITSLTTTDGYAVDGIVEPKKATDFRKTAYLALVVGDVLDRLLWRVRPYERQEGGADHLVEEAMNNLADSFARKGASGRRDGIIQELLAVVDAAKLLMDTRIPRKPLIGMVGEIYLRSHVGANQDLIRNLERFGAEVVNASIAEWVNYTTYAKAREVRADLLHNLRLLRPGRIGEHLRRFLGYRLELAYQENRMDRVYRRVRERIDLAHDHKIGHLERILLKEDFFSFSVGTEACLSIPGIISFAREGADGVVNVFPFTCMPSTATSAVIRPLTVRFDIPYLDVPHDGTIQPGYQAKLRTFMYQAEQHAKKYARKGTRQGTS